MVDRRRETDGRARRFDGWFLKACHRNPEERFASASEQTEALAAALGLPVIESDVTLPGTAVRSSISQPAAKPVRRAPLTARRGLLLVAVLAAASIGVVAASRVEKTSKIDEPVCGLPNRGTTSACGPCMAQACCKEAQECSAIGGCAQVEACVRA
jgi:hypothetical protein